jgi:D-3-phosphoglycerate dehydrogenase
MKRAQVFLTHGPSALAHYYGERALGALRAVADVHLHGREAPWDTPSLAAAAAHCDIIVSDRRAEAPAALLQALPKLAAFVRCAVDIRNVDVPAASALGILVTQASAGFMASVSEWVIGVMIDLSRGVSASVQQYRGGATPVPAMGRELRGATLGVIGHGQIGRHVVALGRAFGMRVQVCDPHVGVTEAGVEQVPLATLLRDSDHLVCLATATPETENLMDADAFAAMKPSAFFINASRGNLVDEGALLAALDAGRIAGAALDVGRAPDQMPSPRLARHPRVVATPHIGGLTVPAIEHQSMETARQVADIVAGRIPPGAVNAGAAHRLQARFGAATP